MITLNRKKLTVMVAGVESFLMGLLVVLMVSHVISLALFCALVVAVGLITSALLVFVVRKFNE